MKNIKKQNQSPIIPLAKPVKGTKISTLRNKADKLMQELGRQLNESCLICSKPMVCMHHYYPKSTSSALRYDFTNLIPICHGCHCSHHGGNPEIHNEVNRIKGEEWIEELECKKRTLTVSTNKTYYREIIANFKTLVNS